MCGDRRQSTVRTTRVKIIISKFCKNPILVSHGRIQRVHDARNSFGSRRIDGARRMLDEQFTF